MMRGQEGLRGHQAGLGGREEGGGGHRGGGEAGHDLHVGGGHPLPRRDHAHRDPGPRHRGGGGAGGVPDQARDVEAGHCLLDLSLGDLGP